MSVEHILNSIDFYLDYTLPELFEASDAERQQQSKLCRSYIDFVRANGDCFSSVHTFDLNQGEDVGHCTGSAIVVSPDFKDIVLTLHRKLKKWLQLGGHADGQCFLDEVAMREAREESGLELLQMVQLERKHAKTPFLFDLDIHDIPANHSVPAHKHFDARYLIMSHDKELTISDESEDLRWFSIEAARKVTHEPSLHRILDKLEWMSTRSALLKDKGPTRLLH